MLKSAKYFLCIWFALQSFSTNAQELQVVQLASRYAPPYSWYDLSRKRYRGYIFYLQEKLFQDLSISTENHQRDYNDAHDREYLMLQLEMGEIDVIVGSDKVKEFEKLVHWVEEPLVELHASIFVKKKLVDNYSKGWESLQGKRGVMVSQQGREQIQTNLSPLNLANKGLSLKAAVNHQEAIDWLLRGKVDYWATDYFIGHGLITTLSLGGKLDSAEQHLVSVPLYIGFSKQSSHQALIPKISQRLRDMRKTGQLEHIRQRFMQDFIKAQIQAR